MAIRVYNIPGIYIDLIDPKAIHLPLKAASQRSSPWISSGVSFIAFPVRSYTLQQRTTEG
jgi:hypothetical protein